MLQCVNLEFKTKHRKIDKMIFISCNELHKLFSSVLSTEKFSNFWINVEGKMRQKLQKNCEIKTFSHS